MTKDNRSLNLKIKGSLVIHRRKANTGIEQ